MHALWRWWAVLHTDTHGRLSWKQCAQPAALPRKLQLEDLQQCSQCPGYILHQFASCAYSWFTVESLGCIWSTLRLTALALSSGQKNLFGKVAYINLFIYIIFKTSFAISLSGHSTPNPNLYHSSITKVEGMYLLQRKRHSQQNWSPWPHPVTLLLSAQHNTLEIPAKSQHLVTHPGFRTCLLLYF